MPKDIKLSDVTWKKLFLDSQIWKLFLLLLIPTLFSSLESAFGTTDLKEVAIISVKWYVIGCVVVLIVHTLLCFLLKFLVKKNL